MKSSFVPLCTLSKQVFDLFDGVRFGVARAINHQPALEPGFIRRAIWFDCSNQNSASAEVTERIA